MIDELKLIGELQKLADKEGEECNKAAEIGLVEKYFHGEICYENAIFTVKKQPQIGEWIPCSERLPEEKINPVTNDFYEYQVTFKSEYMTDIRHYKFGRGHWWNGGGIMDEYVIAWRPLPHPYKP